MAKYVNSTKLQKELFKRTEGYASNVRKVYLETMQELINLVKGTELEDGKPFSFTNYGYGDEATKIFRNLYSRVYQQIRGGIEKEWTLSNDHTDNLIKSVFGKHSIEDNQFARLFSRNQEAMNAFFARKTGDGLNLSQKVWRYTGQYREELENSLDLAMGEGVSANQLATKITQYLQDPDRFYRRFRVKTGEDENGNSVFGRVWKRRIYDKETESYKWIDDNPKKYHPGQGVYRSSYRNAQRLARTETNIAYRTADYERWQELDFVVGIEIKLSNNHPVYDICDELKGVYPKDFKWRGWHPNCRCHQVPILATEEEIDQMLDKILEGDTQSMDSSKSVDEYPDEFKDWVKDNQERMEKAEAKGTLPYFVKDNKAGIDEVLNPLTPEQKHHKDLVSKYGEEGVQKLYDAYDSFQDKISHGDYAYKIKKLEFEVDWVNKNGKYLTSPEMVKMLEKELTNVKAQYDKHLAVEAAQPILGYKSKSKPLNTLLKQLDEVIASGGSVKDIEELTAQATAKIKDIEKARLAKLVKGNADGSTIDLYATAAEKLEVARLQDRYDKAMSQYGSQWSSEVNNSYQELANYKKELGQKYHDKQGKLVKLNGETSEAAAKALQEYLDADYNKSANTPIGGRFQLSDYCGSDDKRRIREYSKLTGISEDELGLITRYTYGSKWCNQYGYGKIDAYFGKVQDYGGLCQKYYPAANSVIEKLPRFQGTSFSGITMDPMELDRYILSMKEHVSTGKAYTNKAFLSSTTNIDKTKMFGDNVQLVIKGKRGADLKGVTRSAYVTEEEVLFRAGTNFKVVSVKQEAVRKFGFGKGWVIELEEI